MKRKTDTYLNLDESEPPRENTPLFKFAYNAKDIIVINNEYNYLSKDSKQDMLVMLMQWASNELIYSYNFSIFDYNPKRVPRRRGLKNGERYWNPFDKHKQKTNKS